MTTKEDSINKAKEDPKSTDKAKDDSKSTDKAKDSTPMPMPSLGNPKKPKGKPKNAQTLASSADITKQQVSDRKSKAQSGDPNQSNIQNDDSGQPESHTQDAATQADQIDAGGSSPLPNNTPPALPSPDVSKKEIPFEKGDPMASKAPVPKKNVPALVNDMDLDRQISDKKTANWLKSQGKEYKVHGIYRPDAASIQGAANKNKVCTEILHAVQTDEYAEVIVRTHYLGQYVDTVVHHSFETSRKIKLLEMATLHPDTVSGFTADGLPIFVPGAEFVDKVGKKKNLMVTIMHTLLADIQFSIRDATTKASAAGQAKILNQDWRGDIEVDSEVHERELVESLRDN